MVEFVVAEVTADVLEDAEVEEVSEVLPSSVASPPGSVVVSTVSVTLLSAPVVSCTSVVELSSVCVVTISL